MMKLIVLAAVVGVALGVWNGNPQLAQIVRASSDVAPDGAYEFNYETENGISAQENGVGGQSAQGSYQYQSPEGENVQVQYGANENGFQPQGSHIPTPPPTPIAIVRLLEWLAAHPQQATEEPLLRRFK